MKMAGNGFDQTMVETVQVIGCGGCVRKMTVAALLFGCTIAVPAASAEPQNPLNQFFAKTVKADITKVKYRPAKDDAEPPAHMKIGPKAEAALRKAITHYEAIVAKKGWYKLRKGFPIRPGEQDPRIAVVRHHLALTGDLNHKGSYYKDYYDDRLVEAVKRYQRRHGLTPTGTIGRQLRRAMNIPASTKLKQLRLNLKRIQDLSARLTTPKFVMVNIPSYELHAINNGQVELASRVIVGRPSRQSPVLDAKIRAVNFMPKWRVPKSISRADILPTLRKDPGYFTRENFKVYRLSDGLEVNGEHIDWRNVSAESVRFEQGAGDNNALGLIRIDMPNKEAVYMHDTPLKKLFDRPVRPFSSGCVRVQKIRDLAMWLIKKDPSWTRGRLDFVLKSRIEETVKLEEQVPVYFTYLTSWVDEAGEVQFRGDLYGRDQGAAMDVLFNKNDIPKDHLSP